MGADLLAAQARYRVRTIAGGDFTGDSGPAVSALLNTVEGLTVDAAGNLYLAEADGHRIRRINAAGIIQTVAGAGIAGYSGDGPVPELPAEVWHATASRYVDAFERLTGTVFVPGAYPVAPRINAALAGLDID